MKPKHTTSALLCSWHYEL